MTAPLGDWALAPSDLAALGARGCFVREGFLGEGLARAVRRELAAALGSRLRPAAMGRGAAHRDPAERGDEIAWLEEDLPGPALAALRRRFDALGQGLRRDARLGLSRCEIQVAHYPGGGARYARHRDAFRDALGPRRRVTAIVYLNPDWSPADGGVLRLYPEDGPRDVEPRLDRLVVFLSERLEHEVLPAHAPRWAVTAWFYDP